MKLELRKISNGYILALDNKETFHDVPEAICGQLAEWALGECKRLDNQGTASDAAYATQLAQAMAAAHSLAASKPSMTEQLLKLAKLG